ncbi:hypothetical protein [Proteiniborus sp. MB09-C3]|uniref:hypothetical protein n=1 Tax=Proteiniborus sp. MB09-C3 TaxID=3050072 RepID=UPI002554366E|nr:hypothetical protein [Proteiniborus sp. MB09-C3]WIV10565.1 hypothetical protein QO263_10390 [Proteiniborus sp. MB09-C3]
MLGKKVDNIDEEVYNHILKWIESNENFDLDDRYGHRIMFHRIGCDDVQKALGWHNRKYLYL